MDTAGEPIVAGGVRQHRRNVIRGKMVLSWFVCVCVVSLQR